MAVKTATVTVTDEPTRLNLPETDQRSGYSMSVLNTGEEPVFVGGPDVTSDGEHQGRELAPEGLFECDLHTGEDLWAVTASGTSPVHVFQTGT